MANKHFEVVDLGVHFPDSFNGFGTSFSPYQESVYGIGSSFNVALDAALEAMYVPGDMDLCQTIWRENKLSVKDNEKTAVDMEEYEDEDDCPYYHVGIRYTL